MLDQERAFFASHRSELQEQYPDKFVLIKGDRLVGAFSTQDEAVTAGARQFGLEPFLVRNVNQTEEQEINIPALSLGILRADISRPVRPSTRK